MDDEQELESQYAWPDNGKSLQILGAPDRFTMFSVVYVKGQGMSVRGVIIPGSRSDLYFEDMADSDVCECHPGMGWELTAIDPDPFRIVVTKTLDTHTAMAWMRRPDDILDMGDEVDEFEACETLTFVPPGETLQTVFNDFNNHVTGGPTMADVVTDDLIEKFFGERDD